MIYFQLEAGNQKYIHFPVLPIIESGEIEVKITAYSPVDKDMEQIKIQVSVSGPNVSVCGSKSL